LELDFAVFGTAVAADCVSVVALEPICDDLPFAALLDAVSAFEIVGPIRTVAGYAFVVEEGVIPSALRALVALRSGAGMTFLVALGGLHLARDRVNKGVLVLFSAGENAGFGAFDVEVPSAAGEAGGCFA
jgi:hypothetical protein